MNGERESRKYVLGTWLNEDDDDDDDTKQAVYDFNDDMATY